MLCPWYVDGGGNDKGQGLPDGDVHKGEGDVDDLDLEQDGDQDDEEYDEEEDKLNDEDKVNKNISVKVWSDITWADQGGI